MRKLPVLIALALVAACGSTAETATTPQPSTTDLRTRPATFQPGEVVRVDLLRSTPAVSKADIAAVVAADTAFGLDLFEVVVGAENLMFSPYSIATALSMLHPGASGATASEIADVLHLDVDDATLHGVRNYIDSALATSPPPQGDEDTRQPFTIRPANSTWGQGGYPFRDEYLQVLATSYGAGLRLLDYEGDAEGSRAIINQWVEDTTEDRIKDLIPEGAIDHLTRLVLVNAIWFKANWLEQFNPDATAPGTFTLLDGTAVEVPLMHVKTRTGYSSTDSFEAVRLAYAGDSAMVVLLPKHGSPAALAASLSPDLPIPWGAYEVDVTLPSFKFETELALKPALKELGMRTAFDVPSANGGADLTGITAIRELYVSDAFHKSFIALDEHGTEAAAATAFVMGLTSLPEPATFTADRPFLFWIEQASTGEILFLGQVTNPA